MVSFADLHDALCLLENVNWRSCRPWWADFLSASNVTTMASALLAAFLGALAGGFANYKATTWAEEKRRTAEADASVKAQILIASVEINAMGGDLNGYLTIFEHHRKRINDQPQLIDPKLWQAVSRIDFQQSVPTIGYQYYPAIHHLQDRQLMERLVRYISGYHFNMRRVSEYNKLHETFENYMSDRFYFENGIRKYEPSQNDARLISLELQLNLQLDFIVSQITSLARETQVILNLLYSATKQHFGSADFLQLPRQETV